MKLVPDFNSGVGLCCFKCGNFIKLRTDPYDHKHNQCKVVPCPRQYSMCNHIEICPSIKCKDTCDCFCLPHPEFVINDEML